MPTGQRMATARKASSPPAGPAAPVRPATRSSPGQREGRREDEDQRRPDPHGPGGRAQHGPEGDRQDGDQAGGPHLEPEGPEDGGIGRLHAAGHRSECPGGERADDHEDGAEQQAPDGDDHGPGEQQPRAPGHRGERDEHYAGGELARHREHAEDHQDELPEAEAGERGLHRDVGPRGGVGARRCQPARAAHDQQVDRGAPPGRADRPEPGALTAQQRTERHRPAHGATVRYSTSSPVSAR
jgi:hypothetical protein